MKEYFLTGSLLFPTPCNATKTSRWLELVLWLPKQRHHNKAASAQLWASRYTRQVACMGRISLFPETALKL